MASILKNTILLGQVIPSTLKNCIKVQVPYFVYDERLKAYFKKTEDFVAQDVNKECKTGDVIIIEKLAKQEKKEITHAVKEHIYHFGDVKDPVTQKMVVGKEYRETMEEVAALYGGKKNFDYKKQPRRGRLEGTRDLTDKPTYRKWHEFDKNDPYGVLN